ncbi:MAG TPA: PIN domain-containing protein [Solirubrobacterales bacterium]|nr:PIN domain-containing protein [Solirubrobacterales bacterium]
MVLPDTSVWIPYFRSTTGADGDRLEALIKRGEVTICGPVLAELLGGAGEMQRSSIMDTAGSLPWAELDHVSWRAVGTLAHRLRQAGQALPLTDLTIAVAAAQAGYALWSLDSDFERIAPVLDGLELYQPA